MTSIRNLYRELLNSGASAEGGGYPVAPIPGLGGHRLGLSVDGQPMFFVQCRPGAGEKTLTGYLLERIRVQFNKNCVLLPDGRAAISGIYTTIELKGAGVDLQNYFLDVVQLMLKSLSPEFNASDLSAQLQSIISLFNNLTAPPRKSIQGLWAELILIEQSRSPDVLIASWHRNNSDKFDFNDGSDKIEVKSTSRLRRIHHFAAEQLLPNKSSRLLIASVITVETGLGLSVLDLAERIASRVPESSLILSLRVKIALILGSSLEQAGDMYFDYALAIDSLCLFNAEDIPKIAARHIPAQVQRVSYDCDLTEIKPITLGEDIPELFKAL